MNVTEVLHFVDRVVQKQRGEHLNDLEKDIIKGLWEGKTYSEIADKLSYNENYIGDISRKLFKILSEHLDEKVSKSNFSWTLEKAVNSLQFVSLINSKINWCPNSPTANTDESIDDEENLSKSDDEKNPSKSTVYRDLTLAPKITHFYDREAQLTTLSDWLIEQNTRLVSVLGLSGIGKTTLVKQFVDLNLQNFDVVVWKNLKLSQSLDETIAEILRGVERDSAQQDNQLPRFFTLLRQQRCLIILDDVQELFIQGELAGQFKTEYKNYQNLFATFANIEHQSNLILISQAECQEMLCFDDDLYPVKCLELKGVNNIEILKIWGLIEDESLSILIDLYEGNLVYLKDIVSLIKNVFGGKVADFLNEDNLIISQNIKERLSELFERLSSTEKEIILQLSQVKCPVSREDLRESLSLSSMELVKGLQSLRQRYLIEKIEGERILFNLSGVVREYLKTRPG